MLFEAPRREITSIAIGANGTIYAACVGDKSHNPLPPLPVQGMASVTITVVQPESLQAANSSASVPEGTEIFALTEGQAPRELWSGKDEIVYALAARPDGLLALSGNRGRIFRIQDDGSYADIAHLQAQQGLSLRLRHRAPRAFTSAREISAKYSMLGAAATHEYASDVLDAGAFARFGRVEIEPGSSGYDILTRTGNVEQPVRGWSDWQPLAGWLRRFACGAISAVEGCAARGRRAGQRWRELSAGELRSRGRRPGCGSRRAHQSAGKSSRRTKTSTSLSRRRARIQGSLSTQTLRASPFRRPRIAPR